MPVYRNDDGQLRISVHYPQDVREDQVHAGCLAGGAFETCKALAQLPAYAGAEGFPAKVLEIYGDAAEIAAFALLGWMRGRELSVIDEKRKTEKVATYATPARKRTWWLRDGVVYEKGKPVAMFDGSPLPGPAAPVAVPYPPPAPVRAKRKPAGPRASSKPGPKVRARSEHAVITKSSLAVLTPEVRKIIKAMPEHQWVGKTVAEVCEHISRRSPLGARAAITSLQRLCWIPESKAVHDIGL